ATRHDGRDGSRIAFANAEVAAPVGLLEAVIPLVVRPVGDMTQAVDLRGDVVADEDGAAMPGDLVGIRLGIDGWLEVALPLDSLRAAEGHDRGGIVPGPFE